MTSHLKTKFRKKIVKKRFKKKKNSENKRSFQKSKGNLKKLDKDETGKSTFLAITEQLPL